MRSASTNARRCRRPRPFLVALATALACLPLLASTCLRVPTSASAPPGLYLLTYRAPARGRWVVACLPPALARFGRRRGYLGAGPCPGGSSEVLKRVAALPGDHIRVGPEGLTVNDRPLADTARRRRDSAGRPIPAIAPGRYRVAPGSVWLYSDTVPTSWDSRYYGPVPLAGVRSHARLLLSAFVDAGARKPFAISRSVGTPSRRQEPTR
jgi:conjugative transfer signal peptidase TraF